MSPPPHQSSHTRCTWDDFSNLTLHPSSVTKHQLHQGACEITFQISPRIHLAWPSVSATTPKFSHKVDTRWLFKCHLASTQDDIWKVYKGKVLMWDDFSNFTSCPSSVTNYQLHQGAHEMTFQISPHVHLAWPSVSATTPKFSREVHMRWLFKSHLTSIWHDQAHQSSHTRWTRDDFANVTSRPRENLADLHHLALGHRRGNI